MQNYEQTRLIMDWECDHYRLGNSYKNKLAKKPVEVVERELAKLSEQWNGIRFKVVPKGGKRIGGDKIVTFKKGWKDES